MTQYSDPKALIDNAREQQQRYEQQAKEARDAQTRADAQREAERWRAELERIQTWERNKNRW